MKERPIPFSGPMVQAILADRKTQTRRVMKPQPFLATKDGARWWFLDCSEDGYGKTNAAWKDGDSPFWTRCPYGVPGDRLWVRESIGVHSTTYDCIKRGEIDGDRFHAWHLADGPKRTWCDKTLTARFMPRWASRLTLEITEVRVQRLQEISGRDAFSEGISVPCYDEDISWDTLDSLAINDFRLLWDSINAERGHGWEKNDWVWALTFRRVAA